MAGQARLSIFVWGTGVAGLAAVLLAWPYVDPLAAAVGFLTVAIVESLSTMLRDDIKVSLSNVVVLIVIIIAGPAVGVFAALGAMPAVIFTVTDMRLFRAVFNGGQLTLCAAAAGLTHSALVAVTGGVFPDARSLAAILAAAAVYAVVNHALVAGAVSLSGPDEFWPTLRMMGSYLAMQVPYVGIAVLTAVVLQRASLWALVLMGVPVLIARFGLVAFQRLDDSFDQMVTSIVDAIEMKDKYTRGHSERVSQLSLLVAVDLGLTYDERRLVRYAALLHDVGKIGVPLCIINKPGPLDDDEFAEIQRHPSIGADILRDIDFLAPALDVVRYHHERLDGRGYPYGVSSDDLDLMVRIVTAADAFDAMTSTRSYRRALTVGDAIAELRRCAGRQFDPVVVESVAKVTAAAGWTEEHDFASEAELHGQEIPVGTAQERFAAETDPSVGGESHSVGRES
jgi:putative nucleotidyltransferase with HDIG domain